jgi:hypothetical protein
MIRRPLVAKLRHPAGGLTREMDDDNDDNDDNDDGPTKKKRSSRQSCVCLGLAVHAPESLGPWLLFGRRLLSAFPALHPIPC